MSQGHIKKQPSKVDPAKVSATLNNFLVIRLVVASVIFAVALILTIPEFLRISLLVLSAGIAGYDIILKAVDAVLNGDYVASPVLLLLISIIAVFVGFATEGAALILLSALLTLPGPAFAAALTHGTTSSPERMSGIRSCTGSMEAFASLVSTTKRFSAP